MSEDIETRLHGLGLKLPAASAAAANYVPSVRAGDLLFVSGQLPRQDDALAVTGHLGKDVDLEQGVNAARLCALNILAQVKAALEGDWGRLVRCVKLGGFVACTPDFTDQPKVVDGASNLIIQLMGEAGRHSRFAVGAPALPLGAAVEIEAVFQIR